MKAVLDTNILVSAHLTRGSTCDRILRLGLDGLFQPCVDARVLGEYETVLPRPVFRLEPDEVASTLEFMRSAGEVVSPVPLAIELPHDRDLPFLEVAAQAGAILVTGNLRDFPKDRRAGVTVLSPREFLDLLGRPA